MLLSFFLSCVSFGPVYKTGTVDLLRTKNGFCTGMMSLNMNTAVDSCIRIGSPGTLNDNQDYTYLISHFVAQSLDTAKPSTYQVTVKLNGKQVHQKMGSKKTPNYFGSGSRWDGHDVQILKIKPNPNDIIEITWVTSFDITQKNTGTLTIQN